MTTNCNLTLDIDQEGGGREPSRPTARIAVSDAWGFTRHGGAATVTRDCTSYAALEREVARLRGELDAALSEARARFGGAVRTAAGATAASATAPAEASPERRLVTLDASLRVADVMTRHVHTLGPNDRLTLAEELMKQGRFALLARQG